MVRIVIMYILLIPCAAAFIVKSNKGQKLPASVFKGVTTWIILGGALAGMTGSGDSPTVAMLLIAAGLAMGLAGDVALSLPDPGFMAGMLFFGLGHICYAAAFILVSSWALLAIPVFAVLYGIACIVLRIMKKNGKCPEELFIPVSIYSGIILAMVSLAATMPFSAFPIGFIPLCAAILFAVSDAMLARNKFESVIAAKAAANNLDAITLTHIERGTISLCCYFLAQSLFAVSVYFVF